MRQLFIGFLILLFVGCARVPITVDVLVRYPVPGEIVWMSRDGNVTRTPYFIINYEELVQLLDDIKENKIRKKL